MHPDLSGKASFPETLSVCWDKTAKVCTGSKRGRDVGLVSLDSDPNVPSRDHSLMGSINSIFSNKNVLIHHTYYFAKNTQTIIVLEIRKTLLQISLYKPQVIVSDALHDALRPALLAAGKWEMLRPQEQAFGLPDHQATWK